VVSGLRRNVLLLDLASGRPRGVLTGGGDILDFAYTPDGASLITAESTTVRVWEMETSTQRLSLSPGDGGTAAIRSLALSPDGRWLALGLDNGEVRLWPGEMLLAE
jgi:WD40 repeat protein